MLSLVLLLRWMCLCALCLLCLAYWVAWAERSEAVALCPCTLCMMFSPCIYVCRSVATVRMWSAIADLCLLYRPYDPTDHTAYPLLSLLFSLTSPVQSYGLYGLPVHNGHTSSSFISSCYLHCVQERSDCAPMVSDS